MAFSSLLRRQRNFSTILKSPERISEICRAASLSPESHHDRIAYSTAISKLSESSFSDGIRQSLEESKTRPDLRNVRFLSHATVPYGQTSLIQEAINTLKHNEQFGVRRMTTLGKNESGIEKGIKFENQNEAVDKSKNLLRPLSPHLPVYKPQTNSTASIFNRITGAYLAGNIMFYYLLHMKMGPVCFSYDGFYEFFFYASKLNLISMELSALALSYHMLYGIRHLAGDFVGVPSLKYGK